LYEILYQLNNNYSSLLNIIEPTTKEKLIIRINQDIGLLFLEYNTISPLNINIIICYQLIDNNIIYIQSTSNKTLYYKISNVKEWKDFLNNKKVIFERSYIYTNNISLKYESIESL